MNISNFPQHLQEVMFEVFEYANIKDGFNSLEGEERSKRRLKLIEQDEKIRGMILNLPNGEVEWEDAERVADIPEVHEVLSNFAEDHTGDNGIAVVLEVMRAVMPGATIESFAESLVSPLPACRSGAGFWGRAAARQTAALRIEKKKNEKLKKAAEEALLMLKEYEHTHPNMTPLGKQAIQNLEKALGVPPMSNDELQERLKAVMENK